MYYQNPVNDFYMRNANNYGQQLLPFPPQQPQIPQVNTRFVTNIEEARAAMIDGVSTNLFLDSGNGKIYLKKMNNNGLSDFLVYTIEQSKEEKKDPIEEINFRLSNIENTLGGIINAKSVSNAQSNGYVTTAVAEQNPQAFQKIQKMTSGKFDLIISSTLRRSLVQRFIFGKYMRIDGYFISHSPHRCVLCLSRTLFSCVTKIYCNCQLELQLSI